MNPPYHVQITTAALADLISPAALKAIIAANLRQDNLRGLLGHPEYHFDNSAFEAGYNYVETQRTLARQSLRNGQLPTAWAAFGRMFHALQDFYAHTNYLTLWAETHPLPQTPSEAIDPLILEILTSPRLVSGRVSYFWEALNLLAPLYPLLERFYPPGTHAAMNLDTPARGPFSPTPSPPPANAPGWNTCL